MNNLSVKNVADLLGVSPHTIRYYDNMGLIPDISRDEHGARVFTQEQLEWLGIVLCMRSTGLSVAGIRHYMELVEKGDSTLYERYQIIMEQKRLAEAERAEIDKKLGILSRKQALYEKLIAEKNVKRCCGC
jgi:DNA-binding transcriptional MerR regulator